MFFLQLPNVDVDKIAQADSTTKAKIENTIDSLAHMSPQDALRAIAVGAIEVILKVALAVAIWYVGRWLIRKVKRFVTNVFDRRHLDNSLRTFLQGLISITLNILLIYIIISILGFNTTSFIALFASAGLALGLALSGTLQNFAGGVMLLLLKPYRVGDYIEAQGQSGTVNSIQLFNTVLTTPDNSTIIVPNGTLSTSIINNTSREPNRRVEWMINLNYGTDFDLARNTIKELLDEEHRILPDKEHTVEINQLGVDSIQVVVRVWTKANNLWDVFFDINRKIYDTLPSKGIQFANSRTDIYIKETQDKVEGENPSIK